MNSLTTILDTINLEDGTGSRSSQSVGSKPNPTSQQQLTAEELCRNDLNQPESSAVTAPLESAATSITNIAPPFPPSGNCLFSLNQFFVKIWHGLKRARCSKYAVLFVSSLALLTDMIVYGAIIPLTSAMLRNIGFPEEKDALGSTAIFALYAVGLLISTPIFGILSDLYGNRQIPMLVGLVGLAGGTLLFAFANDLAGILIGRILQGISAAATWIIGMAMIADVFPESSLSSAMGIALSCNTLGFFLGPIMAGFLGHYYGYRTPFYVCAGLAGLDFIARLIVKAPKSISSKKSKNSTRYSTENKEAEESPIIQSEQNTDNLVIGTSYLADQRLDAGSPIRSDRSCLVLFWHRFIHSELIHLWLIPEIFLLSLTVIINGCSSATMEALLPKFLEKKFNLDLVDSTKAVCGFIMPLIVASIAVGYVGNHISRTRLIMIGFVIHSLSIPLIVLSATLTEYYIFAALFGLTCPLVFTASMPEMATVIAALGYNSSYAKVYAIFNLSFSIGMICGPLLCGFITYEWNFLTACVVLTCMYLVYLPFFMFFNLRMERKRLGVDYSWSIIFKNCISDFCNLRRAHWIANSKYVTKKNTIL